MACFVYVADTHMGPDEGDGMAVLVEALAGWLRGHPEVAFVLHGGDMVSTPSVAAIRRAVRLWQLPVPLCLCLGEHDCASAADAAVWLREAPGWFPGGRVDWRLETDTGVIHAIPPDETGLAELLAEREGLARLVVWHRPVLGQATQGGGSVADRLLRNRCIRGVLASHNHFASYVERDGVAFVATSALDAPPHGFRLVTWLRAGLSAELEELGGLLPAPPPVGMDQTYLRGRPW